MENLKKFYHEISANEELRNKLAALGEKYKEGEKPDEAAAIAEIAAFAKAEGFELTEAELSAYFKKEGGELSEEELENVAGGGCSDSKGCMCVIGGGGTIYGQTCACVALGMDRFNNVPPLDGRCGYMGFENGGLACPGPAGVVNCSRQAHDYLKERNIAITNRGSY